MKKLLLLLLLLITSLSSIANDHLESLVDGFCYESPKAQVRNNLFFLPNQAVPFSGESICVYSKNSQYHSQGEISKGKQEGWWTWWKENGEVWKKEQYDDGEKIGYKKITLNENGQIEKEKIYQNGKLSGVNSYSYYESGKIKGEANRDDKRSGKVTLWYESGQIRQEGNFKKDELNGEYTDWFENGQIQEVGNYKDGKLDGKLTVWYENGQKKEVGNFKNGIKDGRWTYWTRDGQIYKEEDLISEQEARIISEQEALKAKAKKVMAEVQRKAKEAAEQKRIAEALAQEAEALAQEAEAIAKEATTQTDLSEAKAKEAEKLAKEAAEKKKIAEAKAKEAEARAQEAAKQKDLATVQPTIITIDKDGNYYINSMLPSTAITEAVSLKVILNRLMARIEIYPNMQILIKADKDVAYGKVIEVIALLQNEGIEKVGFMVENTGKDSSTEQQKLKEQEALKEKAKKVMAEVQRKAEEAKAKAKLTKEEKDQLSTLKSAYVSNIAAQVKSVWNFSGADDNWSCDVYVQQDKKGNVVTVYIQDCNTGSSDNALMTDDKVRAFMNSIERAIYKSSPLPIAPDVSVWDKDIMFTFTP